MCNCSPWNLCKILHKSTFACAQFHKPLFKRCPDYDAEVDAGGRTLYSRTDRFQCCSLLYLRPSIPPLNKTVNIFFAYYKKRYYCLVSIPVYVTSPYCSRKDYVFKSYMA